MEHSTAENIQATNGAVENVGREEERDNDGPASPNHGMETKGNDESKHPP